MNRTAPFRNLQFEGRPRSVPRRLVAIGIALAVFTGLWIVVPRSGLFWLLLIALAALVWVASFGWREAVARLIELLVRLEQLN